MLWRRRQRTGDLTAEGDRDEPAVADDPPRVGIDVRIEVVEDGRVVYSRPVLPVSALLAESEPEGDPAEDLRAGRELRPGGFVALDFETATSSRASACAVALAAMQDCRAAQVRRWLIRPPGNEYDGFNISIHGITPAQTAESPSFTEILPELLDWIAGRPVVAHYAPFDLSVLRHSVAQGDGEWPELTYYCTCALARREWPGRLSYRLPDLAEECGVALEHHEAGSDASAAGELAIAVCGATGEARLQEACKALGIVAGRLDRHSWSASVLAPIKLSALSPSTDTVPEDGAFSGRTVVFTGTLSCGLTRREAAQRVVDAGGAVATSISKKVDYLVLGIQDAYKLKDGEHSGKMIRAGELRAAGVPIELLDEEEWLRMLPG